MRRAFLLAFLIALLPRLGVAADKVTVRLDWLDSAYHAPFFYGIDKGFYRDAGLNVTVAEGRGSVQTVQLVGKGDDQFGFVAVDAIMRAVPAGIPVISVATLMPVMGEAIYVLNSSGIAKLQDLKGHTVAVTPGGTNEALLPGVLESVGLKDSDLKKVSIDASAKTRMFMNHNVDAMIATAWAHALFESAGGAHAFIYSDYGMKMVGYSLITNTDLAKRDPDLVRRFVAATAKAWSEAKAHPEEALDALAKFSKENAEPARRHANSTEFTAAAAFIGPAVPGKPYGTQSAEDWTATQAALLKYGVIKQALPIDRYMTNAFVPAQ